MSARNRELFGLIPASLLVTAGFAGVFIQRSNALSNVSLTYGAIFLGLCIATHILIRVTLPHADPFLFPLAAALASFGIVMVYRIDAGQARQQAVWFVIGLILAAATIIVFRDYRRLERYRYTIMAVSLALTALVYAPFGVIQHPSSVPSGGVLFSVAVLAIVCTALAFLVFSALIAEIGPVRATVITYVNPAVAAVLGVAVLGETFTPGMGAGFLLVLIGSTLATGRLPRLGRVQRALRRD